MCSLLFFFLSENTPCEFKLNIILTIWVKILLMISNLCQDVKGPQTVAFNLPNDERIVKDRGTSMVMLKNVSEAKYIIFPESP